MKYLKNIANIFNKYIYLIYERIIIPPQNISLLELKKIEFKEKTKYLNLSTLYNLNEDEIKELKQKGYIVDLKPNSIEKINNFKLSYNRHKSRYCVMRKSYNQAIISDSYYVDQMHHIAQTDYQYEYKINKTRIRVKRAIGICVFGFLFLHFNNWYITKKVAKLREQAEIINKRFGESKDL